MPVTESAPLPRIFGAYRLTEELGRDALGSVFRALRPSGERGFVRLRIFESAEISEDAVLDAIEANGEIHTFLKNPSIARGVQIDAVDGIPFLAWSEPNGRTLDALIARAREQNRGIPIEHALLIAEKVATALDHAYNTTVDGERTLHGLVWPGFVSISDDGETRLAGFGLAPGFFPSVSQPRFAQEIAPYLAPEERALLSIGKNSDVYSVGVLLFQLLLGRLPSPTDPPADLKTASSLAGGPIPPETAAVLRTCLSPAETRYQSSGDLRRELGKILFSGPYAPSTFNLAYFITGLFGAEIEAENRARIREAALDSAAVAETPSEAAPTTGEVGTETRERPTPRRPYAIGGALLLAAALASTFYMITRRPSPPTRPAATPVRSSPTRTPLPILEPSSPPTTAGSDAQFKDQVAQRVATELKRLEDELQKSKAAARKTARAAQTTVAEPAEPAPEPTTSNPSAPEPTATTAMATAPPVAAPLEAEPRATPAQNQTETPPKIERIIKPIYPPLALQAGIKGVVLLRVLVSETGRPEQVEIIRGVAGGLTAAAVSAVRKWTFEPGRKNGQPIRSWMTIEIPFEP